MDSAIGPVVAERFWRYVRPAGGLDCWLWTGAKTPRYGRMRVNGNVKMVAHRIAWLLLRGDIPADVELDHLCRVTLCVNPWHLEPVSHLENVRRGNAGAHFGTRTHCLRGHAFDARNTRRYITPGGTPGRECLACRPIQRRLRAVIAAPMAAAA